MNDILSTETKRKSISWRSERFLSGLQVADLDELLREGYDYSRQYRVLELYIVPGRAIAKVQSEVSNPVRIEVSFEQVSADVWSSSFAKLSSNASLFSFLLAQEFPESLEQQMTAAGLQLFPTKENQILITQDGEPTKVFRKQVAAAICKIADRLDTDPFAIFVLRGQGYEESLLMLRKLRAAARPDLTEEVVTSFHEVVYEPSQPLSEQIKNYWTFPESILNIAYSLKADELPAAVLRRLDTLPLSGLEEDIDSSLQDCYAHVANRAQAFALGL